MWFSKERFAGWSAVPSPAPAATVTGVRVGSSRRELEDAYAVKIGKSTLGTEFSAGALGGLLDSAGPDAKITHMWAGATCLAR
jgi:hypothetical protein